MGQDRWRGCAPGLSRDLLKVLERLELAEGRGRQGEGRVGDGENCYVSPAVLAAITQFRAAGDDVIYAGGEARFCRNKKTQASYFFGSSHSIH